MLAWIASVLSGATPMRRHLRQRHCRMSLHRLGMMVKNLILVRAAEIAGARARGPLRYFKHGRDLRRRHFMRSIFGSKLRRALNHRDPVRRIAILIGALRHLDTRAARFAKRLRCGFRRLFAITPAPTPPVAIHGAPAPTPACADSS